MSHKPILAMIWRSDEERQTETGRGEERRVFTEPFRLTSNEYATACSAGADYVLAIVVNSDQFDIRFVCNPVAVLSFERRCERWSWQCSDYASAASDPEQVFSQREGLSNDTDQEPDQRRLLAEVHGQKPIVKRQ